MLRMGAGETLKRLRHDMALSPERGDEKRLHLVQAGTLTVYGCNTRADSLPIPRCTKCRLFYPSWGRGQTASKFPDTEIS